MLFPGLEVLHIPTRWNVTLSFQAVTGVEADIVVLPEVPSDSVAPSAPVDAIHPASPGWEVATFHFQRALLEPSFSYSLHHMPLSDFWKGTLVLWTDVTRVHTSPTWRSLPSVLHPLVSLPQASPPRAPSASSQGCSQTPVLGEGVHSPIPHGLCFPRLNSISVVVWSTENRITAFLCAKRFISINGGFIFPFGFFKHVSSCGEY